MLLTEWKVEDALKIRLEEGVEIGVEKEARRIAQKMKARGTSINEILELTELTVEEVLAL
jgi:predicted transposase YdaD